MAYASARFGYHLSPSDPALETKGSAFDDDNSAVLDPNILEADMMQSPGPDECFRKDSFTNTNAVVSPADPHAWNHRYDAPLSLDPTTSSFRDDGHSFTQHAVQSGLQYIQQHPQQAWPFERASGDCTPTAAGPGFMRPPPPPPFDVSYPRTDNAHGSFSQPPPAPQPIPPQHYGVSHTESNFIPAPPVQTPMSPHSHQDWMGMAQQEMENRPSHKRMRPDSPSLPHVDFQRRDGIRKKNGRIDIPQERNIQNIDDMIEKTSDEELLKELKQQKRLLRNREAALASRQRKKKHTEDLEVKEKNYTSQIAMLEAKLNELTMEHEHRERERQAVHQRLAEAQRVMDLMHDEKRDLIMRHNEEASSLRKKVQVLTEQLETGPAPAMSAVPSSNGFADFNAEMEALNMGPHDWDSFILANELQESHDDFGFDPKPEPVKTSHTLEKKASAATITPTPERQQEHCAEQPFVSGLLFMLLLCGAFVASKPAGSEPACLPNMPPAVRAAAPAVLNNLLADANPIGNHESTQVVNRLNREPAPSGLARGVPNKASRLDRMHRTLTTPTSQQEVHQAFALTPAQYASLTNADVPTYSQAEPLVSVVNPPRHNLAEALNMLEQEHRHSKADVYTRSLLWGQIPADVVRQFKEMVRDHDEIEQRQQHQGHDFAYKLEQ